MLLVEFGELYQQYMHITGRILPYFRRKLV